MSQFFSNFSCKLMTMKNVHKVQTERSYFTLSVSTSSSTLCRSDCTCNFAALCSSCVGIAGYQWSVLNGIYGASPRSLHFPKSPMLVALILGRFSPKFAIIVCKLINAVQWANYCAYVLRYQQIKSSDRLKQSRCLRRSTGVTLSHSSSGVKRRRGIWTRPHHRSLICF